MNKEVMGKDRRLKRGKIKFIWNFFDDVVEDVVDIYDNECVFIYLCVI